TYERNAADPESTGAAEISVFHQFVGGKSGGGPGSPASTRGAIAIALAIRPAEVQGAPAGAAARRSIAAIRQRKKCELHISGSVRPLSGSAVRSHTVLADSTVLPPAPVPLRPERSVVNLEASSVVSSALCTRFRQSA